MVFSSCSSSVKPRMALCGEMFSKRKKSFNLFCSDFHKDKVRLHFPKICTGVSFSRLQKEHSFVSERFKLYSLSFKKRIL